MLASVLRNLLRRPGFSLTVVVTLTVGIVATTVVFSLVNAVVLRSLPYEEPNRLVTVWESSLEDPDARSTNDPQAYAEWRGQNPTFEQTAAYVASEDTAFDLSLPEGAQRVRGAVVARDFFSLLGVSPRRGRDFSPSFDDGGMVVILGDVFWRRHFSSDPEVVGASVRLNDLSYTVVGVMPPGFDFPGGAGLWIPDPYKAHRAMNLSLPIFSGLHVLARLAPEATLEEARASMEVIGRQIAASFPTSHEGVGYTVIPLREDLLGKARRTLTLLFGAVCGVLMLACGNVAFLMLTRATARRRELALRIALGATRFQVLKVCLAEGLLLSLAGGAVGLVLVAALQRVIPALVPFDVQEAGEGFLDHRVLLFTLVTSLFAGLAASVAPMLKLLQLHPGDVLREGTIGFSRRARFLYRALPVFEIALVVLLLIGSGLLIKSLNKISAIDLGIDSASAFRMKLTLVQSRYPDRAAQEAFLREVAEGLRTLPGVRAAGGVTIFPLTEGSYRNFIAEVDGVTQERLPVASTFVTPGYFEAMGLALRQGRGFHERDVRGVQEVAIVDEDLAAELWLNRNPVGRRIVFEGIEREVVGTVASVRTPGPDGGRGPQLYVPHEQSRLPWPFMTMVVKSVTPPVSLIGPALEVVRRLDPEQTVTEVETLRSVVEGPVERHLFTARLLSLFAAAAFVLAAIGIYGVTAYVANLRLQEMAIRMALGARQRSLFGMVLREGLLQGTLGLLLGLAGSWALVRTIASMLYGVGQWDPTILGFAVLMGLAVPVAASLAPARRASRVEPAAILKSAT